MRIKNLLAILFSILLITCIAVVGFSCGEESIVESESVVESESQTESQDADVAIITFDLNTQFKTNVIKEKKVTIGRRVSQPKAYIIEDNPTNLQIYGWYTSKDFTEANKWDFKNNKVSKSMTLYARWVELYNVDYYVNGVKNSSIEVFNGDKIEENAEMVMGYKYLGTYVDEQFTTAFDFDAPVTSNMNLYVKRSPGIYLSDYVEEGQLSSGVLSDYLTSMCGSYDPAKGCEEGWVEEYTIESTGEKCTYVNFGVNPEWGDGYVELSLNLDISQSQIIRLTYKNIGKGTKINCYFTSMLDGNTYSLTGPTYNSNFNWPNYIGGPVGDALAIESEQDENGEWSVVDFNLYEVMKNGYSVWGTSPLLGAIRIEVNYKNVLTEDGYDWSNEMLIKSIEGVPVDIETVDSSAIDERKVNASEPELEAAANLATAQPNGINFVKDLDAVTKTIGNAEIYNTTEGILFWAENEIAERANPGATAGFEARVSADKTVDIETLTTLNVTLQNLGYAESLIIRTYNEDDVPTSTTLKIAARMAEPKTYSVNLYGRFSMYGKFTKVEIVYTSVGVDNMILFTDISFGDFIPDDIVGINFYDKFTCGFETNRDIAVDFASDFNGTKFSVEEDGASITSADKSYDATNEGYTYMTLSYYLPLNSDITAVTVELKVNGSWGTPYVYELDVEEKEDGQATLPLVKEERGYVKAVRLTFAGYGEIVIRELAYSVGELGLPYYQSYNLVYNNGHTDWKGSNNAYVYDDKSMSSTFIKGANENHLTFGLYIGYSAMEPYLQTPHKTLNILMDKKIKVTLVYQNRSEVGDIGIHVSFGFTDRSATDPETERGDIQRCSNPGLAIDTNMGDYEWSAVTIEIPESYLISNFGQNIYLGKIWFEFPGDEITIRAVAIEQEG